MNKDTQNRLTAAQEAFVEAYTTTWNASEAYRTAYPKSRSWKPCAVNSAASQLLKTHKVSIRVQQVKDDLRTVSQLEREDIVRLLCDIIRGKDVDDYKEQRGDVSSKRTISKQWALERLCKMLGYDAAEKKEITTDLSFAALLMKATNTEDTGL